MAIRKMARQLDLRCQVLETLLEALGCRNPAQRSNIEPFEVIERQPFILIDVPEIKRHVAALDNFRRTIVTPNSLNQGLIGFAVALCDENVACSAQVPRWFAQSAAGQEILVAKGCLAIDQDDIQTG